MSLEVMIHDENPFFSLYSYGEHIRKVYLKSEKTTVLTYGSGAVVYLFYTYPTHREACVIRNNSGATLLPSLSKRITQLFSVQASKVDKLRRAAGFLNKRGIAFSLPDSFYTRLYYVLSQRGKINYAALRSLLEKNSAHTAQGVHNAYIN